MAFWLLKKLFTEIRVKPVLNGLHVNASYAPDHLCGVKLLVLSLYLKAT